MKIIIHIEPDFKEANVRTLHYSVKTKRNPRWWDVYSYDYFVKRNDLSVRKGYILDFVLKQLYEANHDVPNCEDCELVEEPVNYRQMEAEDRD